jgi:hypothetical protein
MICTYDESGNPTRIQVFHFYFDNAYEGKIDLEKMEKECETYFDIDINVFTKVDSFPEGHFDYKTHMQDHHYVYDRINNVSYKVSEPENKRSLD